MVFLNPDKGFLKFTKMMNVNRVTSSNCYSTSFNSKVYDHAGKRYFSDKGVKAVAIAIFGQNHFITPKDSEMQFAQAYFLTPIWNTKKVMGVV